MGTTYSGTHATRRQLEKSVRDKFYLLGMTKNSIARSEEIGVYIVYAIIDSTSEQEKRGYGIKTESSINGWIYTGPEN